MAAVIVQYKWRRLLRQKQLINYQYTHMCMLIILVYNIHDETIVILFLLQIECFQIYGFASSTEFAVGE